MVLPNLAAAGFAVAFRSGGLMGIALDKLGEGRCLEIARSLFTVKREEPAEGELFGLCPVHGEKPDTISLSFSYNYKTDKYHCFSCGAGGDLASLWQETQGRPGKEGFKAFCEAYKIDQDKEPKPKSAPRKEHASKGNPDRFIPEADYAGLAELPEAWLARLENERGWSREVMTKLGLRLWRSEHGEERVAIPIRDCQGGLHNIRLYQPGAAQNKMRSWGKGFGNVRLWMPEA